MMEPAFAGLLIVTIGRAMLLASGPGAASRTAIAVSAITVPAEEEHRAASAAYLLKKDRLFRNRHTTRRTRAGWTTALELWQRGTSFEVVTCPRLPAGAPLLAAVGLHKTQSALKITLTA